MDYNQFCEFLDDCKKKGKLPNGAIVTRRQLIKYFNEEGIKFTPVTKRHKSAGTGCLTRWYGWYLDGVMPKKPVNLMRNSTPVKNTDISLQDI